MGLGESIRLALEGLKANKMRAVLTMLGIIIGIAAVIGILTVGDGLRDPERVIGRYSFVSAVKA